ncbi:LacI family DNA-binding transcriptional regulator [Novosphingobium sp. PASSN1]|uniref:LacI family DNA-binding transcriptional regulator n=1 Tax=Novosphingobium sp. PASSN1 TaxID=2015561 RepID=UPI000BCB21B2|nr:LacI family DNA-binding transcriptional regulator [Novosphingobium sp. PASSN1]OYU33598.1 MAG: LacI family transcriptional regulator [Novosphingobium sp. PASSN1]
MKSSASTGERPTMEKVAELAGVSKITVSRALRGSKLVRPEVRERIVQVAAEAGYRMNLAARSLRTKRTHTIAVVIEQLQRDDRPITDPLLLAMIGGLLEVLTPADYAMLLTTHDHFLGSNAIGADGVVVLGQGEEGRGLQRVGNFGLPVVAWGEPVPGLTVPVIGSDNRLGGRLAAEHLVVGGRKRLLFLGDPQHPEVAARLEGVREVLAASEAALAGVVPCAFSTEAGAAAVQKAIADGVRFDGLIAVSDYIAAGACDTLIAHAISVPETVAVVGFDDTPIASTHRPSITSIRQDANAAGRALGEAILAVVDDPVGLPACGPLPVELVVRESSR